MACEGDITSGFSLDCTNVPTKGIVQSVTLINNSDIDKGATVFDLTNDQLMTSLVLKLGKQAFLMEGVKNLLNMTATFTPKDDTFDGWVHALNGYMGSLTPEYLEQIKAFTNGAELTAIVRTKEEGVAGNSAFHVLGYDQPMTLSESVFDPNENGGLPFRLANKDGYESPQFPYGFFVTDLVTTEAFVTALLTP